MATSGDRYVFQARLALRDMGEVECARDIAAKRLTLLQLVSEPLGTLRLVAEAMELQARPDDLFARSDCNHVKEALAAVLGHDPKYHGLSSDDD